MRVEDLREQEAVVEAVLFTMGRSVEIRQLAAALETGEPEPDLTIILACGDRSEFAFSYPLTEREREQLRERMEAYCQTQTGKGLAEYREELLSDGPEMAPGANMGMEM